MEIINIDKIINFFMAILYHTIAIFAFKVYNIIINLFIIKED
jgi:hypothetical protein